MDLNKVKSIHFVGIKGVAMTALAILAKEKGIEVTGSDVEEVFPTDSTLNRFSIPYQKGFNDSHLPINLDLVIYTGAHKGINNIEVQEALNRGIPVLPHGKALGLFMRGFRGITVAGSHGKTTTSALLAHVLTYLGKDPSFAIGCGEILSLKTPGHAGRGEFFVAEGDEYVTDPVADKTPRFMWQKPEVLVITNIDFDHPDVYKDLEAVKMAFITLANSLPLNATIILNTDNREVMKIAPKLERTIITYGEKKTADFRLQNFVSRSGSAQFEVAYGKNTYGPFILQIPGVHNAQNAAGAVAALMTLGFEAEKLREVLTSFTGTKRRFELVGQKNGKLLYDDYAHHPTEIQATLAGVKKWYPDKRLMVIFQPHTYSRTQSLLSEFGKSFSDADLVILTEIYASAREKPIPGISGQVLFEEVRKRHKGVHFAPNRNDVLQYLMATVRPNDLVLTMGAGNIYTWLPGILEIF